MVYFRKSSSYVSQSVLLVQQATIPLEMKKDLLLWNHTTHGEMELKNAYAFTIQPQPDLLWAKIIWSPDIPPLKSLSAWRLMHDKIPTDEKLLERGCHMASI